jgi:apolipoprotein N-acyltransferase
VLGAAAGALAPDGGVGRGALRVAIVQGGGPRGYRGVNTDPGPVFVRHIEASQAVEPPVDLVLWPEDVIDVDRAVALTSEAQTMSLLAGRLQAPVVAGVVEDDGPDRFRNAAVLWQPDGSIGARYDKAHRVPFGEYVPGRSLISKVADLSVIPRDAVPGRGPGVLRPAAPNLGVVISFEVYFSNRARAAANAGAQVLLVPTNAASFKTSQVPTTEVASAQLRAIETGRDLAQAAPTGYSAAVDHRGRVRGRSTLGRRQVLPATLRPRTGRTLYARVGDGPVLLLALAALVLSAWPLRGAWRSRPRRRTSPSP